MTLFQFLLILRARRRIVAYAVVCTAIAALAVSLVLPKRYTAIASVVVDVKSPDPVAGMMLPAMTMPGYMATQVDIINSDRVAYGAIKRLGLADDAGLHARWLDATGGRDTFESWYADILQAKLDVKPSRESNVISIAYTSPEAGKAAAVANAFAQAYIATNVELKVGPAKEYAQWFEQQGKALRERVEQAQARLSEYQQQNGIVNNANGRLDYETQKLNDLQSQVVLAEAAEADADSKRHNGGADLLGESMQRPVIQQLKSEITLRQAKLDQAAGNLGKNHPQYIGMAEEIATLKQRLAAETRQVAASVDSNRRVAHEKVQRLKAAIEAQKTSILALNKNLDQAAVLQREVEAAEKAANAVADRFNQSSLESQSNQTNISVLTPAAAPVLPSSPRIPLNVLVATVAGLLLGIGAALVAEMFDRRIRSTRDVEAGLGIPLLATLESPDKTTTRRLSFGRPMALPG
ncbi:MAG: chain length determinant protein EpsF [Rhodocyclaceae bacterium]|nr:MAG: chain length determinant protein EpsF [Rhodocyclaceae bacterium]